MVCEIKMSQEARSISVCGCSANVHEASLREFFSYCGDVETVVIHEPLEEGAVGRKAVVTFTTADAVTTAVLLTGAIIVDSTVEITPLVASSAESPLSPLKSATSVINNIVSAGLLKGEKLVRDVREKAHAVDEKNGITATISTGVKVVVDAGKGVVQSVTRGGTKGTATTESWMYGNQPQWGAPPEEKK